jgi:hypothetical protein
MFDTIVPVIAFVIILGLLWGLLKLILKLTTKIFSWGCLLLLLIGAVIFILGGNLPSF